MKFGIHVDVSGPLLTVRGLRARLHNLKPAWNSLAVYSMGETAATFRALAHGGTFRGVTWAPFKDQYTRKTDGVTVPAWGGVPRLHTVSTTRHKIRAMELGTRRVLRTGDFVQGRRRGKGKRRVEFSSNLLRDTGAMAGRAGMEGKVKCRPVITTWSMEIRVHKGYAAAQQYGRRTKSGKEVKGRPFLFWHTPTDAQKALEIIREHIMEVQPGTRAAPGGSLLEQLGGIG